MTRWILIFGTLFAIAFPAIAAPASGAEPIDFVHEIVPVLKSHCVRCHGGEESKGGFSLNTRALFLEGEAALPGEPQTSRFLELIGSDDPDDQMPPKDFARVPKKEQELLARWVREGMKWDAGFSFAADRYEPPLEPRRPELPPAVDGRPNPIDRILDAHLRETATPPPETLGDAAFYRRLSYDLIGLPPSPEALEAFCDDPSPRKRDALVERLLARDVAYAEHWMTFWNDLLRNAYSGTGFIDGGRKQITGWLYKALLENKAYDRFVRELISPTPASEGFIRGIKWRGEVNASQQREIQFSQSISQVFLGINMKCASCHDSFIDRWTLDEAYGLAAVYAQEPLQINRCDKPTGRTATPAWIFPELGQLDPNAEQPQRLTQLADLMTHPDNGRLARTIVNRLWHRMMGRGIVHPVDAMQTQPWNADLLDYLAVHLVDNDYDLKATLRLIATSAAYQSRAAVIEEPQASEYRGPLVKRMTAEQYLDSIWSLADTWPEPDKHAFERDGRQQGGQLAAVLEVSEANEWGDRPLRSVFTPPSSLQRILGRPSREQVVAERPTRVTTLEAITLANGDALANHLNRVADEISKGPSDDPAGLVERTYLALLSRRPTVSERSIAIDLLGDRPTQPSIADFLWLVVMLPEFHYIH